MNLKADIWTCPHLKLSLRSRKKKPGNFFPRKKSQAIYFRDLKLSMRCLNSSWPTKLSQVIFKSLLGSTHRIWDRKIFLDSINIFPSDVLVRRTCTCHFLVHKSSASTSDGKIFLDPKMFFHFFEKCSESHDSARNKIIFFYGVDFKEHL